MGMPRGKGKTTFEESVFSPPPTCHGVAHRAKTEPPSLFPQTFSWPFLFLPQQK